MTRPMFHFDAVVSPGVSDEQIRDVLRVRGAKKIADIPREDTQLREEVWALESEGRVRLVWDHFVDILSLRAESTVRGAPADIIHGLREPLASHEVDDPLKELDDLMRLVASKDRSLRSHAVRGLAAITDRYYKNVVEAFTSALFEDDRSLREVALRCIARWPHVVFVTELEKRARVEPDPLLRAEALQLAKDVRQYGRRGNS